MSESFVGFSVCLNGTCKLYNESRPLDMHYERVAIRAVDMPVEITSTEHLIPDGDTNCPECGNPAAVQPVSPPKYGKVMSG